MNFANRMNGLGNENAFKVLAEVLELRAQGKEIMSFCIGEPDFNTPENIKQTAIKALNENQTHYTGSAGLTPIRQSVAEYINKLRGTNYSAENVVITPGGKGIIFLTVMALVNEGDEVIYPNPGYPIYESAIDFFKAKKIPLPALPPSLFNISHHDMREKKTCV